ncbi:uncharacterized protein N7484_000213 [Penicillium longicatenatum]|uniref:uncharacterized protein n=1 Tax=Penicillium longicatenatum TaxID=1561947 RepID=UPI0025469367|nr:uncharacterized protein N7484_000213 [Penicillium longicatenatum]KAJ5660841.1 hypothetical protein N7484_000213 [Penicillium longicatenatum]
MAATVTSSAPPSGPKGNVFVGTEGIYLLPHHQREIERLQKQHNFFLSSTNGILLTVPLQNQSDWRILDSGAADGTWLRSLAQNYPSKNWSLHGVDIGSALFPLSSANGPVLDLQELDIRQPAPESLHWENSFDLIHQRLLIWGLQGPEWLKVLRNQRTWLKPGGWIQLVEAQWVDKDVAFDPVQSPNLAKMTIMQKWSTAAFGMNIYIAYDLENLLQEAGLENIRQTSFSLGYGAKAREEQWKVPSAEMWVDTFRSLGHKMPPEGIHGVAQTPDEFDAFLDALKVEVLEQGYAPQLNFVIGQKPL